MNIEVNNINNIENNEFNETEEVINFVNYCKKNFEMFILNFNRTKEVYYNNIKQHLFNIDLIKSKLDGYKTIHLKYPILITEDTELSISDSYLFYRIDTIKIGRKEFAVYKVIKRLNKGIDIINKNYSSVLDYKEENKLKYNGNTHIIDWGYSIKDEVNTKISAEQIVHFGVFGGTGSGKTYRTKYLLKQYAELNGTEFFILDKNLNDYVDFACSYENNIKLYTSLDNLSKEEDVILYLMLLLGELNKRNQEFKEIGVSNFSDLTEEQIKKYPRKIIVLDEFQSFRGRISKSILPEFDSVFDKLITVSRSYGFTIIISTQNLQKENFPKATIDNLNFQVGYINGIGSFKNRLGIKNNEDELIRLPGTFLFYDKLKGTFFSTPSYKFENTEEDKQRFKTKLKELSEINNRTYNFMLEQDFNIIDESLYNYFEFKEEDNIVKNKDLLTLYYLKVLQVLQLQIQSYLHTLGKEFNINSIEIQTLKNKIKTNSDFESNLNDLLFSYILSNKIEDFKLLKKGITIYHNTIKKDDDITIEELTDKINEKFIELVKLNLQ